MAAKRARTGCLTCRGRKLKCDEVKPVCGNCRKSNRECKPSEGITFRHQQNAGLNSEETDGNNLDRFYRSRQSFNQQQLNSFLPVPQNLSFILITDPYAEEHIPQSPPDYQQVAAHTLEALSTAATGNTTQNQTSSYTDYNSLYSTHNGGRSGYGPARADFGPLGMHLPNHQNTNINFLLNPSNTPSSLIDPNLETSADATLEEEGQSNKPLSSSHDQELEHDKEETNQFDQQILAALRGSGVGPSDESMNHVA